MYLIGKVSKKYYELSFFKKTLFGYFFASLLFFYFHEDHLPLGIIFLLVVPVSLGSLIFAALELQILAVVIRNEERIWPEMLFLLFSLCTVFFTGLLENRAGWVFLFFASAIYIFSVTLKQKLLRQILLLGLSLFICGIISFKGLQSMEFYVFKYNHQKKYNSIEIDLSAWKKDEAKRVFTHPEIPLKLELPEGFFFHNPKNLSSKDETGTGQIAGIISPSEKDTTPYPNIRIFLVSSLVNLSDENLKTEYQEFLDFQVKQGEIESLSFEKENINEPQKWKGQFWKFYDILRPRDARSGYYLIPLGTGNKLILDIRENLTQDKEFHSKEISQILEKIKLSTD